MVMNACCCGFGMHTVCEWLLTRPGLVSWILVVRIIGMDSLGLFLREATMNSTQTGCAPIPMYPRNKASLLDGHLAACHQSSWTMPSMSIINFDTCHTTDMTVHQWQSSIPIAAARMWNSLSLEVTWTYTLSSFRSQLKTYCSPYLLLASDSTLFWLWCDYSLWRLFSASQRCCALEFCSFYLCFYTFGYTSFTPTDSSDHRLHCCGVGVMFCYAVDDFYPRFYSRYW